MTGSARLKTGNTADKWRDNSERGWKKKREKWPSTVIIGLASSIFFFSKRL
jgi:hypothetical protein